MFTWTLSFALLTVLPCVCSAQTNYRLIRESVNPLSCGINFDSSDVFKTMRSLENLDTNRIRKNLYLYYQDLGNCYWLASGGSNEKYLLKAIEANRASLHHKPSNTTPYWNLAHMHVRLGNCNLGKQYMEQYKKLLPKKYWDEDNVKYEATLMSGCE